MSSPGLPELLLILLVVLLLFGAKRLPDLSRSVGRSLRILKAETKALHTDDEEDARPAAAERPRSELVAGREEPSPLPPPTAAGTSSVRTDPTDPR